MLLLLLLMLLFTIMMMLPLRVQADVLHARETRIRLIMQVLCFRKALHMKLADAPDGRRLTLIGRSGMESSFDPQRLHSSTAQKLTALFRASPEARGYLRRHVHMDVLNAFLRLHTSNAARTALLTGCFRALTAILPPSVRRIGRFSIMPDFHQGQTCFQLRCILHLRLGTLLVTAGLLLARAAGVKAMKAREAV